MKNQKKTVGHTFRGVLRQMRLVSGLLVAFGCIVNLLYLVTPLYMLQVYDRVLASERHETLLYLTVIAIFALLILGALEAIRGQIQVRAGLWLEQEMSREVIRASLLASTAGALANAQPLRDLSTMRAFIGGGMRSLLDIPWTPIFLVALWILHPWLAWLGAGATVVLLSLAVINEVISRSAAQDANRERVKNFDLVDQVLHNSDAIHAMGMMPRVTEIWDLRNSSVVANQKTAGSRNATIQGVTRFVRLGAQTLVLGLGAVLVLGGEISAGTMIAGSILLGRALAPVEGLIGAWRGLLASRESKRRIMMLADATPAATTNTRLPDAKGAIQVEAVGLTMAGLEDPVLSKIDFSLKPGEMLAITGPSASGKSSLCRLLVGSLKPSEGHVRIDGAEISACSQEFLADSIGYLPQDVELLPASVSGNISRLAQGDVDDAVVDAARLAGAHEIILGLPEGYDTMLGAGGHRLSGGQRQRIGLARALFNQPKFIVLDEPNSNLDGDGEASLLNAIEAMRAWDATLIVVTHSRRLLTPVDHVLRIVEGQQVVFAPREEVVKIAKIKGKSRPKLSEIMERSKEGMAQEGTL